MENRYEVVPPPKNGFRWWTVIDNKFIAQGSTIRTENFVVADFYIELPNAEKEAREFCDRLNKGAK